MVATTIGVGMSTTSRADNLPSSPMMRALAAGVRGNVPTLLWGMPGTTKTAVIEALGRSWGYSVESLSGANREPSDFMGFPIEQDGVTSYSDLGWAKRLADSERGLAFFDELTTCAPSVQKVMLRIFQERIVGELPLGDHVAIIGAANPTEVAVDGWDLPAPVANRLMHLDWFLDTETWLENFVTDFKFVEYPSMDSMLNDGSPTEKLKAKATVVAFLKTRPDMLIDVPTNPVNSGRGWPSPRSWTNAAAVISELHPYDTEAILLAVTGCVGDGAATEFVAWLIASDLYDPESVLADPTIVDWSSRPDRIFALMSSIVGIVLNDNVKARWESAMAVMSACAEAGLPDLAYPSTRKLLNRIPKGAKVPEGGHEAFADILQRIGRWAA